LGWRFFFLIHFEKSSGRRIIFINSMENLIIARIKLKK
jgi:hypothetical protein